jgi:hypothetical protein
MNSTLLQTSPYFAPFRGVDNPQGAYSNLSVSPSVRIKELKNGKPDFD